MQGLQDKRVWVWGGTSGIGLATARALATAGARLIVAGRSEERLRQALGALPDGTIGESVDAADPGAIGEAYRRNGVFDHLVVSIGGTSALGTYRSMTEDALRRTIEGKFWQFQRVSLAALPHLDPQGSITWVTGAAARAAIPGMAAMAAGNGALHAMVGPVARDLAPIRVNAVSPGFVDTPYWERALDAEARSRTYRAMADAVPVKRVGTPDDIAAAVALCVTNGFMTGAIVDVDGGRRLV
ncbi:MAG: SDR family oxidoreductase [Lautropia sp.]